MVADFYVMNTRLVLARAIRTPETYFIYENLLIYILVLRPSFFNFILSRKLFCIPRICSHIWLITGWRKYVNVYVSRMNYKLTTVWIFWAYTGRDLIVKSSASSFCKNRFGENVNICADGSSCAHVCANETLCGPLLSPLPPPIKKSSLAHVIVIIPIVVVVLLVVVILVLCRMRKRPGNFQRQILLFFFLFQICIFSSK